MNADQHIEPCSLPFALPLQEHLTALGGPDEVAAIAAAKTLAALDNATFSTLDQSTLSEALQKAITTAHYKVGAAAISTLIALGICDDDVAQVLLDTCNADSLVLRWKAINAVGRLKIATPDAIHVLREAMEDTNGNVRRAATKSMGMLAHQNEAAAMVLLSTLDSDDVDLFRLIRPLFDGLVVRDASGFVTLIRNSSGALQRQLLSLLIQQFSVQDPTQAQVLLNVLNEFINSDDLGLINELCRGIQFVAGARHDVSVVVPGLLALLERDVPMVITPVLGILGGLTLGPAQLLKLLRKFKDAEQDHLLRVLSAVGNLSPQRATAGIFDELCNILRSADYTCRLRSVSTLKTLQAPRSVILPLAGLLFGTAREETTTIRQSIIDLLDRVGADSVEYIEGLRESLDESFEDEQKRALLAFGSLGEKAVSALGSAMACLHADDEDLVNTATLAIANMGALAVNPLLVMLDEDDVLTNERAMATLEGVGRDGLVPLLEGLTHEREYRRVDCAFVLAQIEPRAGMAIPSLLLALQDNNAMVRRYCAEALGHIAQMPEKVVPALGVLLDDPSWDVQAAAAEAIASFGADVKGYTPRLLGLLKSDKPQVRCAAVIALDACTVLEPAVSAPLLDVATQDPIWYVRKLAGEVLAPA